MGALGSLIAQRPDLRLVTIHRSLITAHPDAGASMRTTHRRLVIVTAAAAAVIAGLAAFSPRQPEGTSLARSVGLKVTAYLQADNQRDNATSSIGGVIWRNEMLVEVEGVLTGASDGAVTIEAGDKVYWIPLTRVQAIEMPRPR
jgi:hypothetical protein